MPAVRFRQGDVVLVPFPFADLSGQKLRPALIISANPQTQELMLAFITSVLTNHSPRGAEVEISRSHTEFVVSGLKVDSLIRLDKVVTLASKLPSRRLGAVGPMTKAKIIAAIKRAFDL